MCFYAEFTDEFWMNYGSYEEINRACVIVEFSRAGVDINGAMDSVGRVVEIFSDLYERH